MPMNNQPYPRTGASIIVEQDGKVLLIKRGKQPYSDHWSLPGGGQEIGEALERAALRELKEETGLIADALEFMRVVDRITRDTSGKLTHHYVLAIYRAKKFSGNPVAGDDAKDIGWYSIEDMLSLKTTPETPELLAEILTQT